VPGWRLEHSYAALPALLFSDIRPTPVAGPQLVAFNAPLAVELGFDPDALTSRDGARILAGNVLPPDARPIAQAYAGHQFGHFTALGDGRAILLGEQRTPAGGRLDIQLKGAGPTPYARRGDGRAALGPMLREYIISEAMHALGIPTTRSLAVVTTGEPVYRESALDGAILTRVASSHVRVGTMQWAAAHKDKSALEALSHYTRRRHYPTIPEGDESHLQLLDAIIERQAALIARWQLVGFIHGVMNTDNMALSGETIDYGPCAFMDTYGPDTVFSSIDSGGRYAYGNQPAIALWNLTRLAEAMLPLFASSSEQAVTCATASLDRFDDLFTRHWLGGMRAKLGLFTDEPEDLSLVEDLLTWMHLRSADFTNTFRALTADNLPDRADLDFDAWHRRLLARRSRQPQSPGEVQGLMRGANPAVIARNHLVEAALQAATTTGDRSAMTALLDVLATPFDHDRDLRLFTAPGDPDLPYRTFCGT
jgi:uncharacterized protein YdiU (UPF0061 family)